MHLKLDLMRHLPRANPIISLMTGIILLISIALCGFPAGKWGQTIPVKFHRLSIEDGLSQSSVYCFFQDKQGFVWLGTEDGLNRFDGHNFKIYKNRTKDPASLSHNHVKAIIQDRFGAVWIGTYGGGLNRFDLDHDGFQQYRNDLKDPSSLSNDFINSISSDPSGFLWIGTDDGLNRFDPRTGKNVRFYVGPDKAKSLDHKVILAVHADSAGAVWVGSFGGGLDKYDPEKNQFTCFMNNPRDPSSLSQDAVRAIFEDKAGNLWVGTEGGLNKFDRKTGRCLRYEADTTSHNGPSNGFIFSILETRRGDLWIGTAGGLNRFDANEGKFEGFLHNPNDLSSLSNNEVFCLMEDTSGVLWVGTHAAANLFDQETKPFFQIVHDPNDPASLSDNFVRAFYEDRTGVLWVGGYAGLDRFDREQNRFYHYTNNPRDPMSLSNDLVMSIYEDQSGDLWVGTRGGLNRLIRERGTFQRYKTNPDDPRSLSSDIVRAVYVDRTGVLWIGTEAGLNRFNKDTGNFTRFLNDFRDPESLSNDYVYAIAEDNSGALWIGTVGGLNRLDRESGRITRFVSDPEDPRSLSSSEILSLFVDHRGELWVGTPAGLNKYDQANGAFKSYLEKDGLANDIVYSILEDDDGRLWMSSVRGLIKFDPQTEKFKNYDLGLAFQGNEFNLGSQLKSRRGDMYFGGVKGFIVFRPEEIKDNTFVPTVPITGFQISNKEVPIGPDQDGRTILDKSIARTDGIEISYRDHVIAFEFASLHYAAPEKNRYAYIMHGFEKEWNEVGNRRFATYTNLPPGRYVFSVRGSNSDGVWNTAGTSIRIKVTPQFWMTWWFRGAVFLAVLGAILGAFGLRTRKIRKRNRELEFYVENRTSELKAANLKLQNENSIREQAETEIRRLKDFNERIVQNMSEGIVMNDLHGVLTFANASAGKMLGYNPEELIGKHWKEIVPLEHQAVLEANDKMRTQGYSNRYEADLMTRDGEHLPVQISGAPIIENESFVGTIAVFTDISELKRVEEQRRLREAQNALIYKIGQRLGTTIELSALLDEIVVTICQAFDYYGVMLLLLDQEGKILQMQSIAGGYANIFPKDLRSEIGRGMIGYAAASGDTQISGDVSKEPHFVYLATEDTKSELAIPIKRRDRVIGVLDIQSDEYNAFDKTDITAMETLATQIASALENARLYEQAQREIAERRQAEANLQKTTEDLVRSNKELELFAYIASHDLQEPLRMVASYVQLLARRYKDKLDADAEEFVGFAVDGAARMQRMINDLLTYSRVGRKGKPFVPTDLEMVVKQVLGNLQIAIEESRAVVIHNGLPTLCADETQLVQLFQNLIGNAITFKDKNRTPVIQISSEKKDGEWIVCVSDNGMGIDPQHFDRIFQVFQRLHTKEEYPGTGIGLAVCRRIVERHGGRIWVESEPGKGAAFYFTIPIRRNDP